MSLPPMESTRINNCVATIQQAMTKNWKRRPTANDSSDWDFDPRPKRRKWSCHLCATATPEKRTICDCGVHVHLHCKQSVACTIALTPRPAPKRTKWACHLCGESGPERRARCDCTRLASRVFQRIPPHFHIRLKIKSNEVKLRLPPLSNPKKAFGEILLKQNSCEVAFDFIFISLGQVISQGSFFLLLNFGATFPGWLAADI